MNLKKKQEFEKNLEIIAKKEGISTEKVREEIGRAVSYALKSDEQKVQHFWSCFPCEGDSPTVEEIISYLADKLSEEK